MNRQIVNPWQNELTELLKLFSYNDLAKEVISKASALNSRKSRQSIQMKDYILNFDLRAFEESTQTIITDQGSDFFITSLGSDFNQDQIDVNIPFIRFRDDNQEINFASGYPATDSPGFQSLKNFGPANDHISTDLFRLKILSEQKPWTYYLGDRKYLNVTLKAGRIPAQVTILCTGFQFYKKELGI